MKDKSAWFTYIVQCKDNTLYVGITTNMEQRLTDHNSSDKKGAKYTRSRRPVQLVHVEEYSTRSQASQREFQIKKMNRRKKLLLIDSNFSKADIA